MKLHIKLDKKSTYSSRVSNWEKISFQLGKNFFLTKNLKLRVFILPLLLAFFGTTGAWGQDYSGIYYIASRDYSSDPANTATNFYLCPTENWYYYTSTPPYYTNTPNGQPFMTTYRCRDGSYDANKAVWIIEKHPVQNYYYIKRAFDGKYLTYNVAMGDGSNAGRMRVHLEETADGDNSLFQITYVKSTTSYDITTKNFGPENNRKFLNITGASGKSGNINSLVATNARTDGPGNMNVGGIVGLWTAGSSGDSNSRWYLESATITLPTITNNEDGTFTIAAEDGVTIYYTTDGTPPTTSTPTSGTSPVTITIDKNSNVQVIKAISNDFPAFVITYDLPVLERPIISTVNNVVTITAAEGATIYYTTDDTEATPLSGTLYSGPFTLTSSDKGVRAIATKAGYYRSAEALSYPPTTVHSSSEIVEMDRSYILASDFSSSASIGTESNPFKGTLDGNMVTLENLSHPLVAYADGATIKNVILKGVSISGGSNAGAICNEATGDSRIYNCGVLGGTVGGNNYVGGIVGLLDGTSRVINCYSFAEITGGDVVAGIVGYNKQTSSMSNIKTIVMNCMFYGEISGGSTKYPVYGGNVIANNGTGGINNYNYYRGEATFDDGYTSVDQYNRSWPAEEQNLTRFEYYRNILNSNRKLCTWWVRGMSGTVPTDDDIKDVGIAKWVLDPEIAPYPILKPWGKYPSVINIDTNRVWDPRTEDADGTPLTPHWVTRSSAPAYQGKSHGTLTVTVSTGSSLAGGLTGRTETVYPVITDMDTLNHDYGYYKIQLPYYNDVFGSPSSTDHLTRYYGNYTDKVVTGWKITSVTGGTQGTYSSDWQTGCNFADRYCTDKDKYSVSGRVFAQGGYYYVPEGVTGIEIEACWGKAFYLHGKDHAIDRVSVTANKNYGYAFTPAGTLSDKWVYNDIPIYDDLKTVVGALTNVSTVYDQAIVLVGNFQVQALNDISLDGTTKKVTFMSADLDIDNEPDFCWQLQWRSNTDRRPILPVRFDFLPIPELGLAIRHNTNAYAIGIFVPRGHFEITETSFMHTTQFEYMSVIVNTNHQQPLILNGGEFEQIVAHGNKNTTPPKLANTRNIILGGHVWMRQFTPGSHSGQHASARHCAISVMGGEFPEFYLTGLFYSGINANNAYDDSPHCYTNGGRFGIMAGAGMEAVKNDVVFKIDHSIIREFYGGGINAGNPVAGNINVTINNSLVIDKYCGGPKIGSCQKVTTSATGTVFNKYYGGGNGGTNLYRENFYDNNVSDMPGSSPSDWQGWNGFKPLSNQGSEVTYDASKGYHAQFEFEVFNQSNGINSEAVVRTFWHWAQFGTTVTKDVSNTLTNCTLQNSFYGGGNLGNVDGSVTSTLSGCTVSGSAFGAGYSASIPSFQVHDKSTVVFPFRDAAGVCHNGTVDYLKDGDVVRQYTWCYRNPTTGVVSPAGVVIPSGVSTSKPTFQYEGKWYCLTTESLENLGAVTGDVTLTIDGVTKVEGWMPNADDTGKEQTGGVFGGGDESAVHGNILVDIKNTDATDGVLYVYGGGNTADVTGDTEVKLTGGKVVHDVFGGGKGSSTTVTGNVTVNLGGKDGSTLSGSGQVLGDVYGGSALGAVNATKGDGDVLSATAGSKVTQVNIYAGTVSGSVFGGGLGETTPSSIVAQNFGNTTVTMEGGTVSTDPESGLYGGANVNGVLKGSSTVTLTGGTVGKAREDGALVKDIVFGGGFGQPTLVEGDVTVSIGTKDGSTYAGTSAIHGNVYGGSALGNTNASRPASTLVFDDTKQTDVYLYGGTIYGNVFGGGLGRKAKDAVAADPEHGIEAQSAVEAVESFVGGDVTVILDGAKLDCKYTEDTNSEDAYDDVVPLTGQIFGCNNWNGTPLGHVLVHVKRTVDSTKDDEVARDDRTTYDVAAVYGGGNQADYVPTKALGTAAEQEEAFAEVIIEGCDLTSIAYVYGGGNAAAVPATEVTVRGTYIIDYLFGGGNGKPTSTFANPGADIGLRALTTGGTPYAKDPTKEAYGTGKAVSKLIAGKVHVVYGDSNTKGNVRGGTSISMPQPVEPKGSGKTYCNEIDIREIYGAGQNADQDGSVNVVLGCVKDMEVVYGGAKDAHVAGGINLTITSGHFTAVYGGNNQSGTIQGPITLNIEETACDPITIDNLYLGGNLAAYSIYGYKDDGGTLTARTKAEYDGLTEEQKLALTGIPYDNPVLNVVSCTSIDNVYGGGLGAGAVMYGSPTLNLNMIPGDYAALIDRDGNGTADGDATLLGTIGNVFGGGKEAAVHGNPTINIGTEETVTLMSREDDAATSDVNEHTPQVKGAYITGNVYGGGQDAIVEGDAQVNLCAVAGEGDTFTSIAETIRENVSIAGAVFGAGYGETTSVNNTTVAIGGGAVKMSVYGGGELGSVEANTRITIIDGAIGDPDNVTGGATIGNVYGGGKGEQDVTKSSAGLIKGNTTINITGGIIYHNIYGGGAYGSVGTYTYDEGTGTTTCASGTGNATITITGGTIGINGKDNGMVFGSSRGEVAKPTGTPAIDPNDRLAWVNNTHVTIGTGGSETGPAIKGSVYGSGENGHTYQNTEVIIHSGTIGLHDGTADDATRGNVYGGGCGTDKYDSNDDGTKDTYNLLSGRVNGTTTVLIDGGQVMRNVYGAGAMGSVDGSTSVTITGNAVIGYDGVGNGYVYAAARGDDNIPDKAHQAYAGATTLTIGTLGSATNPTIKGDAYGGGEAGIVKGAVAVNLNGGTVEHDVYGGGRGSASFAADVDGSITVEVKGGKADNVFGCNNINGSPQSAVTVNIKGGTVTHDVYGGGNQAAYTYTNTDAPQNLKVNISGGTMERVFGGGLNAAVAGGISVAVSGGTITNDVYGGGALANTNTANWDFSNDTWDVETAGPQYYYEEVKHLTVDKSDVEGYYTDTSGGGLQGSGAKAEAGKTYYKKLSITNPNLYNLAKSYDPNTVDNLADHGTRYKTIVSLTGGIIGNAYGGGLGQLANGNDPEAEGYLPAVAAMVYGDVILDVNGAKFTAIVEASAKNAPVTGRVFGCNNVNGTPKGNVTVTIHKTMRIDGGSHTLGEFEIQGVYGGGNLAEYVPETYDGHTEFGQKAKVIINDCDASISKVYGGGNAAKVPLTDVTVNGAFEIGYVFGGGNGGDMIYKNGTWIENTGADVQYYTNVLLKGGTIGQAFGGSDSRGTVYGGSDIRQETGGLCPLRIVNLYGAGNGEKASSAGDIVVDVSGCGEYSEIQNVYGGSYKANITGSVTLNIKSGIFTSVFGGNDRRGSIGGNITVNIEETDDCEKPIIIQNLYGGCYQTAYPGESDPDNHIPAKDKNGNNFTTGKITVNVKSATRIDRIFGGSDRGEVTGDTEVNINMLRGAMSGHTNVPLPSYYTTTSKPSNIEVTTTTGYVTVYGLIAGESSVEGYYYKDVYTPAEGTAVAGTDYYRLDPVRFTEIPSAEITVGTTDVSLYYTTTDGITYTRASGTAESGKTYYKAVTYSYNLVVGIIAGSTDVSSYYTHSVVPHTKATGNALPGITYYKPSVRGNILEGIGTIGNVYGGGNIGKVTGSTTVNIGTAKTVIMETLVDDKETDDVDEREKTVLGAHIYGDVFGGCNDAVVTEDATVNIGTENYSTTTGFEGIFIDKDANGGGSVYGGGCMGDILGNTNVTIDGGGLEYGVYVFNGIFGGGYAGSVGTFTRPTEGADVNIYGHTPHAGCIGKPVSCAEGTGKCTVKVTGGQIGPVTVATEGMPVPQGWVWGGGFGINEDPAANPDTHFKTYVGSTDVTIGGTAFIMEGIIGGGEFGRVLGDTEVTIEGNCQIGVGYNQTETINGVLKPVRYTEAQWKAAAAAVASGSVSDIETAAGTMPECSHWAYESPYKPYDPYFDKYSSPEEFAPASTAEPSDGKTWIGVVFGGGSGYMPYEKADGTGYDWCRSAGWVEGNTTLNITGGHILTNAYGGNEYTDVGGSCTVNMSGGTLGVPRTLKQIHDHPVTCYLFGAGKGDQRTHFNDMTNVGSVDVTVSGGIIFGSVFGGSEDGHVLGDVNVTISEGTSFNIGGDTYEKPIIGTWGTSYVDGNVFGGGRGFSGETLGAGNIAGNVTVEITGGTMLGSIYGGGRMASVGTNFSNAQDPDKGQFIDDETTGENPKTYGHITINISGGNIGGGKEGSESDLALAYYDLKHSGNVFGGCMGRLTLLDGTPNSLWTRLAQAKSSTISITGGTIGRNVYGGSEFGTTRDNVQITIDGTATINGHVYGGGYGSTIDDASYISNIDVGTTTKYLFTPMQYAGIVGGETEVNILGGTVKKNVYGGGEMASVGIIDYSVKEDVSGDITYKGKKYSYINAHKHDVQNPEELTEKVYGFGLSWPYEFSYILGGKTTVNVSGGRIGTGWDDGTGYVFGGGKGEAFERYKEAHLANVRETEVNINYATTEAVANVATGNCVAGAVYGGGEDGHVYEKSSVNITGGLIGLSVYGGGKGEGTYTGKLRNRETYEWDDTPVQLPSWTAGKVYGNSSVTMSGGHVMVNVYGGGNLASVGKGNYAGGADDYYPDGYGETLTGNLWTSTTVADGLPDSERDDAWHFLNSGECTVTITAGTVGIQNGMYGTVGGVAGQGSPTGMVFGGSRGKAAEDVGSLSPRYAFAPEFFLGYANNTQVTIGDADGGPTIYGNVFGGGRDGHVRGSTHVIINDGEIGQAYSTYESLSTDEEKEYQRYHRGNVYGSGSGLGAWDGDGTRHGTSSGSVTCNTTVDINGGIIHNNVYGGGAMASVGPPKITDYAGADYSKCTVNINGGTIGDPSDRESHGYGGDVHGASRGGAFATYTESEEEKQESPDNFATTLWNDVNVTGGIIAGSVYGGGRASRVKKDNKVTLTHGEIMHDVFGGGMGTRTSGSNMDGMAADVGGNTTVILNEGVEGSTNKKGCIVHNRIFGCNDMNGTPKGNVLVHVYATQHAGKDNISQKIAPPEYSTLKGTDEGYAPYLIRLIGVAKPDGTVLTGLDGTVISSAETVYNTYKNVADNALTPDNIKAITDAARSVINQIESLHDYDVQAVYGGGNLAPYEPTDATSEDDNKRAAARAHVIIEGCDVTSIKQVYGGGNAAPVPATEVEVRSVFIIDELFGGGNGLDTYTINNEYFENPGANVGYHNYRHYVRNGETGYASETHGTGTDTSNPYKAIPDDGTDDDVVGQDAAKAKREAEYAYGTGQATTTVTGGHVHYVYGGSNVRGNIRTLALSQYQKSGTCTLVTDETYGGSKTANIDAEVRVVLDCVEYGGTYFGGSQNANINNNVTLDITNGTYDRIFGGNNLAGTINGTITINVEEKGCTPIIIGELYGGGYMAPYSIYGYKEETEVAKNEDGTDLVVDGKTIYQKLPYYPGETGAPATPRRSPHINIISATSIGSIYGGGYKAKMIGNPRINVNMTEGRIISTYKDKDPSYATSYTEATDGTGDWIIPLGTLGNIYGGGNEADVIGNTYVEIGTGEWMNTNDQIETKGADGTIYTYNSTTGKWDWSKVVGDVVTSGSEDEKPAPFRNRATITGIVYGGGRLGHVGYFTFDEDATNTIPDGKPISCADGTGFASVTIMGGKIGRDNMKMTTDGGPDDAGHVFGGGQGTIDLLYDVNTTGKSEAEKLALITGMSEEDRNTKQAKFDNMAYVNNTEVVIGGTAFVKGSVYGGGFDGHVLGDTHVIIDGDCQIGCGKGTTERHPEGVWEEGYDPTSDLECESWPYEEPYAPHDKFAYGDTEFYDAGGTQSTYGGRRVASDGHTFYGNVFGGGSGYYPYAPGEWNHKAGWVEGNTLVEIKGGHILTNVYGGNELTNVGDGLTADKGKCTIRMSGGTLGVPRTLAQIAAHPVTCYLFGAGKGDQIVKFNTETNVREVEVDISGGWIYGSAFGGGEDGHVLGDVRMTIRGDAKIGTWGTSYVDGNVFGGGRGFSGKALTAGVVCGNVEMNISGGQMLGSIYGGGRLGSIGTHLVKPEHTAMYGVMIPDGKRERIDEEEDVDAAGVTHGHVTINITGGTIGNSHEFVNPSLTGDAWTTAIAKAPHTLYDPDSHRLLHTKGGNVFAGGMGRRTDLQGNEISNWTKLGDTKSTKLTISGDAWIMGNVYGGGEFGAVTGSHTVTGGTIPTGTEIIINGGTIGTEITATVPQRATIEEANTVKYTFGSVYGGGYGTEDELTGENRHLLNFSENLEILGALVEDSTYISMTGGHVRASVYGGGEVAAVKGSSHVNISGGKIGRDEVKPKTDEDAGYVLFGGATMGNVYGGGKGTNSNPLVGVVQTNTNINISAGDGVPKGEPFIYHNVYGGGALGSVGKFHPNNPDDEHDEPMKDEPLDTSNPYYVPTGVPYGWTKSDFSVADDNGIARITITGGTIGISGRDNGMVNGSSRGDVGVPEPSKVFGFPTKKDPYDRFAYVNKSYVTIGTKDSPKGPAIKGSVYGGGENGHNNNNAYVTVYSGTIGVTENDKWYDFGEGHEALLEKAVITRGNIYGAGCGTDTYKDPDDGYKKKNNPWSGSVSGDTEVNIYGGHVMHNVYGGGSMGSVGVITKDLDLTTNSGDGKFNLSWPCIFSFKPDSQGSNGHTTVNIYGGRIGTTGSDNGDVFGGARGMAGDVCLEVIHPGSVKASTVNINFTPGVENPVNIVEESDSETGKTEHKLRIDMAANVIAGSVYGGGENGLVYEDTHVNMANGLIGHAIYGGGKGKDTYIPTGKDKKYPSLVAGKVFGNTYISMTGGQVLRNIYGGGNLASVGKGNYAGGADDYSTDGYGEKTNGNLWTSATVADGLPDSERDDAWHFLNSGKTNVSITGGEVGFLPAESTGIDAVVKDDLPTGNIFGGCRGQAAVDVPNPTFDTNPDFFLGYVNETNVKIGLTEDEFEANKTNEPYKTYGTYETYKTEGTPKIRGSVYGGGQDGHVRRSTKVTVNNGEIGIPYTPAYVAIFGDLTDGAGKDNLHWLNRGNIFGAGSGIGMYEDGSGNKHYSFSSGSVTHNTWITVGNQINGTAGNVIYRNVYGGGSLASVGPPKIPAERTDDALPRDDENTATLGKQSQCTVEISGMIGAKENYNEVFGGEVYGAGRGMADVGENFATSVWTKVFLHNGANIRNNVFGGGDAGIVKKDAEVYVGDKKVTP